MASILVVSGPNEGEYHPLVQNPVVVGREETCVVQILDETVSRRHIELRFDTRNERFSVLDLGSGNGTFVNDRPIRSEAPLSDGDIVRLGSSELMFSAVDFTDREVAFDHYRRHGERGKSTVIRQ